MQQELRPYQEDALKAIRETVGQGVRRLVVQAPTGSGKTRVAAAIVEGARSKGNRLTFVVPAIQLVDQTVEMFWNQGVRDIGVIQADHQMSNWALPVQVASIQTINSRGTYPDSQIVVIDEVHQLHKAHVKWLQDPEWQDTPFIGLSATPWTRGLGRYFESLLVMSTTAELIEQGYLSKFKVFASDHPDLSQVKDIAGDYHEGQLSRVMQQAKLVANIIETWRMKWGKDRTFVFGVDCAHAQMLQARFIEAGITCGYQDAHTPIAERAALKRAFHNGEIRVICNVATLTTGVDYDVRCLVLARPTKSEILFVQIVGRCLRIAEGKDFALILDHTDTTSRLGLVTDIHHERLDDGRFKAKKNAPSANSVPLPRPCPQCDFLVPARTKVCPECGHEFKIESKITEREGELVEIDPSGWRKSKRDFRNHKKFPYSYEERARFYAQLRWYGQQKGYKPGWAKFKYKEKFEEWPPWGWEQHHTMPTGPEVMQFIRSRFIAWANDPKNPNNQPSP